MSAACLALLTTSSGAPVAASPRNNVVAVARAEPAPAAEEQPLLRATIDELRGSTSASRATLRTTPTQTQTSTPTPAPPPAPPPGPPPIVGSFPPVEGCAATVPEATPPNGQLALDELCDIGDGHLLRADAAATYFAMNAAFAAEFGTGLQTSDSYRSYGSQVSLYAQKPGLAARPGTSNHGWGVAVDLFGGVDRFGSAEHAWLVARGAEFGWVNPGWAQAGGSRPEPWHWEFDASLLG